MSVGQFVQPLWIVSTVIVSVIFDHFVLSYHLIRLINGHAVEDDPLTHVIVLNPPAPVKVWVAIDFHVFNRNVTEIDI